MAGRKNKYETHVQPYLNKISEWAGKGVTENQIAKELGIGLSAFYDYKNKHSEFSQALKKGRADLVTDLKGALVKRAMGFHYEEKKTYSKKDDVTGNNTSYMEISQKYALPDVAALNLALKNWDDEWRNDPAMYELKKMELELRKKIAEESAW